MDQNRLGATASFIRDYLIENLLDGFDVDWARNFSLKIMQMRNF